MSISPSERPKSLRRRPVLASWRRPGHPEAQNAPEPAREAQNGVDSRSGILQTPKELVESPFPFRNQPWKETFCSWTRKPNSYPLLDLSFLRETLLGLGRRKARRYAANRSFRSSLQRRRALVSCRRRSGGAFPSISPFRSMCLAGRLYSTDPLRTMRLGAVSTGVGSKVTSRKRLGRSSNSLGARVSCSTSVPTRDSSAAGRRGESDVAGLRL